MLGAAKCDHVEGEPKGEERNAKARESVQVLAWPPAGSIQARNRAGEADASLNCGQSPRITLSLPFVPTFSSTFLFSPPVSLTRGRCVPSYNIPL